MTDLPVTRQDLVEMTRTCTQEPAGPPHQAGKVKPPADGLDLLENGLRQDHAPPASRERFRVLAPLAAALAVVGVVLGLRLASSDLSGTARLVSAGLQSNPGGAGINGIAFNPDGKLLATGDSQGGVKLWNATGGKLALWATASSAGVVNSVAFSPDGTVLATGGSQLGVQLWNATAGKLALLARFSSDGVANSVAFSPDGAVLAAGDDNGTVWLWNTADPARPALLGSPLTAGSPVRSVAFSPDGRTLAAADSGGSIAAWDIATALRTGTWTTGDPASSVNSVAFSPNGRTLAAGDSDGSVTLLNSVDGTLIASVATGASVNGIAFSPDGRTLVAGNSAGRIDLLDEQGHLLATYPDGGQSINSVAFASGTETLAAGNTAGEIKLFTLSHSEQAMLVSLGPNL
jgi:WD40 repeat protein